MSEKFSNTSPETYSSTKNEKVVESENDQNQAAFERELEERSAAQFLLDFKELRVDINEEATTVISSFQQKIAVGKNMLSTPKSNFLNWRVERAKQKYDRRSSKMDTSQFDFINNRYARKASTASNVLQRSLGRSGDHDAMMQQRLEKSSADKIEREANIERKRKELHDARIEAIERRIIRHEKIKQRNELNKKYYSENYTYKEREEAVEKFINQPAFKKRIRKQAEVVVAKQEIR